MLSNSAIAVDISAISNSSILNDKFTLLVIGTAKIYSSWDASAEPYELHIASAFRVPRDHRDVLPGVSDGTRINFFIIPIDQHKRNKKKVLALKKH